MTDLTAPITKEQQRKARPILDKFPDLCLMSIFIPKWDKQSAAICYTAQDETGDYVFYPIAIVVTDDLFGDIIPAGGL